MISYLTFNGLEKLKKELDELVNVKRKEISQRLKYTASFGDLKENAAYHEAKEAQGFLEGRISELKKIVADARLIEKGRDDKIALGSTVELQTGREKQEFQIVGSEETDVLNGKISYLSPLGQALLGKTKGDKAVVKTPRVLIEYTIIEIK